MKKYAPLLVALYACLAMAVSASPLPVLGSFKFEQPGDVLTVDEWNTYLVGAYSYLNDNVVALLNKLTTKGDLYVYNGISVERLAAGANGRALTADSDQANGLAYSASPLLTGDMTTKGDTAMFTGTTFDRVPVGLNGQALSVNETADPSYIDFPTDTSYPGGAVIAWSPSAAGTTTIPTGWKLCNGSNGTPNLIGLFVLGGRPSGDNSTPGGAGFGAQLVDAIGAGTKTHTHAIAGLGAGLPTSTGGSGGALSGMGTTVAAPDHVHTLKGVNLTTDVNKIIGNDFNGHPSWYVLVYIMKTPS